MLPTPRVCVLTAKLTMLTAKFVVLVGSGRFLTLVFIHLFLLFIQFQRVRILIYAPFVFRLPDLFESCPIRTHVYG